MRGERGPRSFTAFVTRVGGWYVATCEEVAEATARGRTREACLKNLRVALGIALQERKGGEAAASPAIPPVVVRSASRVDRVA